MILTGVTAILHAAHVGPSGSLHGHTWHVTAWTDATIHRDAECLKVRLEGLLKAWNDTTLPPELSTGEAIAAAVGQLFGDCVKVTVERPGERIAAEWTP